MTFIYEEDKSLILNASRIYVSYSGGADSTYALVKIREYLGSIELSSKLTALHFNHGNKQSDAFESHCNDFCNCLLYTSPSPRDGLLSRMPSSA